MTRIWHNPRCSKSRQTLALLQQRGVEPEIYRYLDDPPDADALRAVLALLRRTPRELIRTREKVYRELSLADADDDALIAAMTEHPRLIERPIVEHAGAAALGRPPEDVLALFPDAEAP